MFRNGKELKKYNIQAADGSIGTVHDFFFDDKHWTTRYLVVDTIKWLPGRKVLVSPMSIQNVDSSEEKFEVSLTKEKIKESPDIDTDKPVSKQYEVEYGNYYGYAPYWRTVGTGFWGPYWYPSELVEQNRNENLSNSSYIENENESNLRSMNEVTGYHIQAKDGEIGHIEDMIICDKTWTIRYIVVDTKNWWPGKKVLVSPEWITDVIWTENIVNVDLKKADIENGPEYMPNEEITREYEDSLFSMYGKRKYWE